MASQEEKKTQRNEIAKKKKTDHAPRRRRAEDSRRFLFCFCFFLADDCGSEKMKNKRRTTKHTTDPRDTMRRGQRPKNDCEPKRVRRRHFIGKKRRKKNGVKDVVSFWVSPCASTTSSSLSLSVLAIFSPERHRFFGSESGFFFVCLFFFSWLLFLGEGEGEGATRMGRRLAGR